MRIAIFGAGSIGSLFAAYLAEAGAKVGVVAREAHGRKIQKEGLKLVRTFSGEKFVIKGLEVITDIGRLDAYDALIVSVKAFDLQGVLAEIQSNGLLKKPGKVLGLIQNGLGNEEIAREVFPDIPLFRVITTNGAMLEGPARVSHTGLGDTYIGAWDDIGIDIDDPLKPESKTTEKETSEETPKTSEKKEKQEPNKDSKETSFI